jgi:hypothetical protein
MKDDPAFEPLTGGKWHYTALLHLFPLK